MVQKDEDIVKNVDYDSGLIALRELIFGKKLVFI